MTVFEAFSLFVQCSLLLIAVFTLVLALLSLKIKRNRHPAG